MAQPKETERQRLMRIANTPVRRLLPSEQAELSAWLATGPSAEQIAAIAPITQTEDYPALDVPSADAP